MSKVDNAYALPDWRNYIVTHPIRDFRSVRSVRSEPG